MILLIILIILLIHNAEATADFQRLAVCQGDNLGRGAPSGVGLQATSSIHRDFQGPPVRATLIISLYMLIDLALCI